MTLGQVRKQLSEPKAGGVLGVVRGKGRDVVVQVEVGTDEASGEPICQYRSCRAVGALFIDGEFKVVIAAGDLL
jgi:hypothetical protein